MPVRHIQRTVGRKGPKVSVVDGILFPQDLDVGALAPSVTVVGKGAFKEVIRVQ